MIPSVVHVSKYGAKTCAGKGVGVAAAAPLVPSKVARMIAVAASVAPRSL
jgi:hypothetical protein